MNSLEDLDDFPSKWQACQKQTGEIPVSELSSFLINLTADNSFTLTKNSHVMNGSSEELCFFCRRNDFLEGHANTKSNVKPCPFYVKISNFYCKREVYQIEIQGFHNHATKNSKANNQVRRILHRSVRAWIIACLRSGMSTRLTFMASINRLNIPGIGSIPTSSNNARLSSSSNSIIWNPTLKQIINIKNKLRNAHQCHISDNHCVRKLILKYRNDVVYMSTFEDTDAVNQFLEIRKKHLHKSNCSIGLTHVPKDLFLCVLQTDFMRKRMIKIQKIKQGDAILHYHTIDGLDWHGQPIGSLLYKNEFDVAEIIAYIISSEPIVELLSISLSKLVEVGLSPDAGIVTEWNYIVSSYKCIFDDSFSIFISSYHLVEGWKRWLVSVKNHPINLTPTEADRITILDKIKTLATTDQENIHAETKLGLFNYCRDRGLHHIIEHYNEKYANNTTNRKINGGIERQTTGQVSEDCWCLLFKEKVAKWLQNDNLHTSMAYQAPLNYNIENKKITVEENVVERIICLMKYQEEAVKLLLSNENQDDEVK
ncbi:hypothetical protein TrispH2_011250 [Trichoplax sp. H2]|nr:hypothetical protein TrispH2_011250 [Trichoplax sp. H2]|eukprot:RDD36977.1 hypothetical protein TrispH2_011250 [Trichoplax sp. H2]